MLLAHTGPSHFAPVDVLDYIYGVLHAPSYRARYREFLRIDFPRVPWPGGAAQFRALAAVGAELRAFHLLAHPALGKPGVTFPVEGMSVVEKGFPVFRPGETGEGETGEGEPASETGRVYINETQYFGNVPAVAWAFYIGGYQPAQKWLKDRRGRALGYEDVRHYQRVLRALAETARLTGEADEALLGE